MGHRQMCRKVMVIAVAVFVMPAFAYGFDDQPDARQQLFAAVNQAIEEHAENPDALVAAAVQSMNSYSMSVNAAKKDELNRNLEGVRELYKYAEACFAAEDYAHAVEFYRSVSLATAQGSEDMARDARAQLLKIEHLATERLKRVQDAEIQHDDDAECRELQFVLRNFSTTQAGKEALRLQINLRSRPAIAARLDLEAAAEAERQGRRDQALTLYSATASNLRYENTVARVEAEKNAARLQHQLEHRQLDAVESANAQHEARALLLSAKNLLANGLQQAAAEKLRRLRELYPTTPESSEAVQLLNTLSATAADNPTR